MRQFTTSIQSWLDGVDSRWKQLPVNATRRIVLYGFSGYLLITLAVIVQVVYQVSTSKSAMEIEHISNTVAKVISEKKDTEIKNADYERD